MACAQASTIVAFDSVTQHFVTATLAKKLSKILDASDG